jgi:hypothetical protein
VLVVFSVWLVNVIDVGANPNVTGTPVPERFMVCGLPVPVELIVSVPVRVPTAVGVKPMLIVQVAFAANDEPQLLELMVKSPVLICTELIVVVALFPVTMMPIGVAGFETATLLKLIVWELKLRNAWLASGTERSHTPRPWVTARNVREAWCSFRPNTATLGSPVARVVHVGDATLQLVDMNTPISVAA